MDWSSHGGTEVGWAWGDVTEMLVVGELGRPSALGSPLKSITSETSYSDARPASCADLSWEAPSEFKSWSIAAPCLSDISSWLDSSSSGSYLALGRLSASLMASTEQNPLKHPAPCSQSFWFINFNWLILLTVIVINFPIRAHYLIVIRQAPRLL